MNEINVLPKKSTSSYLTSIMFLTVVLLCTIGLHFYNNFLIVDIEKLKTNINSIETNISNVEKDKNLQIYSLLELNKETINSYNNMNKVTKYINHMNVIKGKYNLEFLGFNLVDGKLTSNVKIISDEDGIAYIKTKDFIEKYRNDIKALFNLDFVSSFEGMDEIKFKVNLKIK